MTSLLLLDLTTSRVIPTLGILVLPILVLNSSSLVRACISAGSVFHIVGAKVRKLLYPKEIWLDFGISRSKGFLYWCCEGFILEGVDLLDHTSIFLLRTINHRVIPIIRILS